MPRLRTLGDGVYLIVDLLSRCHARYSAVL